jgi:exosome complex component RRP43
MDFRFVMFCCVADIGACCFCIRTTVLADPTAFEEPLLDTSISIVLDEHGALLSTSQLGIADKDTMFTCVAAAKERYEARGREIYSF